ncbi:MAG: T9SS type A sorting domain-containing protein, partial [Bacteroidales bacterium]|nr:T9SS type A sorting domain-containing protein [Bacteroidales bacterium]
SNVWLYHECDECPLPPDDGYRKAEYNYWSNVPIQNIPLYPALGYDLDPTWTPLLKTTTILQEDEALYFQALDSAYSGNLVFAEMLFDSVIALFPDSLYALAAMRDLLGLEERGSKNFQARKEKFASDSIYYQNSELIWLAEFMIKECNIRLENYEEAIEWLENEITNPNNYTDSICALIDIGFVNALMANSGLKNLRTLAPNGQSLPVNNEQYESWYHELLKKLFIEKEESGNPEPFSDSTSSRIQIFNLGPNPSNNGVIVFSLITRTEDILNITVYNLEGKVIINHLISTEKQISKSVTIDLSGASTGMYFLKIFSENKRETVTAKLIVN